MVDKIAVGERIRGIRSSMGMSQAEFTKVICGAEKTSGTVGNWEAGYNLPNAIRLQNIAFQGQISVAELLHGKRPDPLIEWIEEQLGIVEITNLLKDYPEVHYNKGYVDAMLDVLDYIKLGGKDNE